MDLIKEIHYILMVLLLASLAFTVVRFYLNIRNNVPFETFEDKQSLVVMMMAHIQMLLGLILLFGGPYAEHFSNMKDVMAHSDLRFILIEHPLTMLIGVVFITIGRFAQKKKTDAAKKFKTIAIYYGIGLVIFLLRIPWDKLKA